MFPLGQVVVVAGVRCVRWNDSCLFFVATLVLGISLLWSPPALLAFSLSLLPRLRVPDFSLQVTPGCWPTPFLAAPPVTATTTAPLVGVSAHARWSPPPVASSAPPGLRPGPPALRPLLPASPLTIPLQRTVLAPPAPRTVLLTVWAPGTYPTITRVSAPCRGGPCDAGLVLAAVASSASCWNQGRACCLPPSFSLVPSSLALLPR